ncbi:cytochrome P450 [Mastigocladopsis repens]|uniref:cytochrome P450 n=1 Tax=Mastigocladopsis repens TaxID=221287 RepID=UPI0002E9EFE7|nr:cytochrome P450 [Mastigocladopsis repens]
MSFVSQTPISSSVRYPPGPKGYPILGNLPELYRDPLGFLNRCNRNYGDIIRVQLFKDFVYILNHPDYIEEVLVKKSNKFAKPDFGNIFRLIVGNGLVTSEGNFWHRQRQLIQPSFHRQRFANYGELMVAYTTHLLTTWQDGQTRYIYQDMKRLALETITKILFQGNMPNKEDDVETAIEVSIKCFDRADSLFFSPLSWFPTPTKLHFHKALQRLDAIVYSIIQRRRITGGDREDLLSMFLYIQDANGICMTDKELRDEVMTLLVAGSETVSIALSWTWYLLSQHPEVEAKLTAELQTSLGNRKPTPADLPQLRYAEMVVMESLRLYPPTWFLSRTVVSECEIAGYPLPAGGSVLLCPWMIHRDHRFFEEPEIFTPERWANDLVKRLPKFAYFPFGGGARGCIGKYFAMMQAVLVLATIAQKFRLTLLPPSHRVKPLPGLTLRPNSGLKMLLTKR